MNFQAKVEFSLKMKPVFQVPIIKDMLKRKFYRSAALATGVGIVLAEIYYRGYVIPHRQRREEYFKEMGITYVHPFNDT